MPKSKCYARCHLTLEEYGLWQYAREVSYASGKFFLSGPKVATEYRATTKNTVYRVGKLLIAAGWFQVIEKRRKDLKRGLWKPPVIRALSHDDWVKLNGRSQCQVQPMADVGDVSMPDSGHGAMTNSKSSMPVNGHGSMPVLSAIHDRNREQDLEVSSDTRDLKLGTSGEDSSSSQAEAHRDLVSEGITWLFNRYVRTLERNPKTCLLNDNRRIMLKSRLEETIRMKGDIVSAVNFMASCIDAITESDWHMGRDPKTKGKTFNELENIFSDSKYQQWVTAVEREQEQGEDLED